MTLIQKTLVIVTILLLIGTFIIPTTSQNAEKPLPASRGNWLYVGGSGPGNYTKIQDAIDNASDGDTVFVYNGTYFEHFIIDKAITLRGESKNSTIIEKDEVFYIVEIFRNFTSISGFTMRNTDSSNYPIIELQEANNVSISDMIIDGMNSHVGILFHYANYNKIRQNNFIRTYCAIDIVTKYPLHSRNNTIVDNRISGDGDDIDSIQIFNSDYNTICNNKLVVHQFGIALYSCSHNIIENNTIFDAYHPILIRSNSQFNTISYNHIENTNSSRKCKSGIDIDEGAETNILRNTISNYTFGIFLKDSFSTVIEKNNFFNNKINARFYNSICQWFGNYWGRPRILPKPIFGVRYIDEIFPGFVEFDWHPAQEPYDIPVIK